MSLIQNIKNIDGIELSGEKDERVIRDDKWVDGINQGDTKAFEAIYKGYYSQLYNFLLKYISSDVVIEDIIHNVFYKIWQNRNKIEPRGTLKSYLFTSVRNQAFKHIESVKKVENEYSEFSIPDLKNRLNPENTYELKELEAAYQEAVKKLPAKRRNIFLMHRQDHLTYKEIAEILNISTKTVETQMSRSLKFLSMYLSHFR